MPQFDQFTFLTQLFWVFSSFSLLYLALSFYLLPAIYSIVKTRHIKLTRMNTLEKTFGLDFKSFIPKMVLQDSIKEDFKPQKARFYAFVIKPTFTLL